MIATLEVVHRGKLSHPTVGNVTTALCQSRQLHAIACCLLGCMQLGEIEPLALTQALVAALAGVSGASVPSPLAQGPSGVDLSSGAAESASPCKGAVLNSHSDRAVLQSTNDDDDATSEAHMDMMLIMIEARRSSRHIC